MKEQMMLLIGYDGSQSANAALDDLRRAGLPREAQAIILTVFEQWLSHASGSLAPHGVPHQSTSASILANRVSVATSAAPVTETRALALQAKTRLQALFPSWDIKAEESSGSPASEILKKADDCILRV